jgi:N-acetylglutamate synthase-like GNAT family acetyltransferase
MANHRSWVLDHGGVLAFAVVERRGPRSAEILWAAVSSDRRNEHLGTRLVDHVLAELRADGVCVVEVKTLDPSADYVPYVATRAFWSARGFIQLDMIDPLPGWPPGNPCAILVAALAPTR